MFYNYLLNFYVSVYDVVNFRIKENFVLNFNLYKNFIKNDLFFVKRFVYYLIFYFNVSNIFYLLRN